MVQNVAQLNTCNKNKGNVTLILTMIPLLLLSTMSSEMFMLTLLINVCQILMALVASMRSAIAKYKAHAKLLIRKL